MRKACLLAVYELARRDERVVFVGSDITKQNLEKLATEFPDRFFMEGIYEGHIIGMCAGLAMSLRLLHSSHATDRATEGIAIRESDRVASPVTLGIARPAIVLPGDWRQWDGAKLDAVLAHELSHIRRHDPAVQMLSAIHRALLWHSPLSWFLHRRIVRLGDRRHLPANVQRDAAWRFPDMRECRLDLA